MSRTIIATFAVAAFAAVGCASDEAPEQPIDDAPGISILDDNIDGRDDSVDAVDTNVEDSENLGFDESDEG